MKGKFFGVNIALNDWKTMTIRAKEALEDSDYIFYESMLGDKAKEEVSKVLGAIDTTGKKIEELDFPEGFVCLEEGSPTNYDSMDGIRNLFKEEDPSEGESLFRGRSLKGMRDLLDQGHNISFITPDPNGINRICASMCAVLQEMGYETEVIPGISSFTYDAAMAKLPLTGGVTCRLSMWRGAEGYLEKAIVNNDSIIISVVKKCHIDLIADILKRNKIPLSSAVVLSDLGTDKEYVGPIDTERDYALYTTVVIQKCGWN